MPVKHCKKCNTEKPVSHFTPITRYYKDKVYHCYQSACKPCMSRYAVQRVKDGLYIPPARKKRNIETSDLNMMKSPLNWFDMKGEKTSYEYKEYPVCQEGHKYVGPQCLPCKYYSLQRSMV